MNTNLSAAYAKMLTNWRPLRQATGTKIASVQQILDNTPLNVRDESKPYLLTPIDAQPVMAAGVTFVESLMGRLIEERARGQASKEEEVRRWMMKVVSNIKEITGGVPLEKTVPGTATATKVLDYLINDEGLSHHYLNVGYGELAEIFTKAHSFNSIGTHEPAGYHWLDPWTNPEPEGAVVINSRGEEIGAVLSEDMKRPQDRRLFRAAGVLYEKHQSKLRHRSIYSFV